MHREGAQPIGPQQPRTTNAPGSTITVAARLMALVIALVCALTPMGVPLSRATGSAFDPTTTLVTLTPASQKLRRVVSRAVRDPEPEVAVVVRIANALLATSSAPPVRYTSVPSILPSDHEDHRPLGARAPPIA